MLALSNGGNLLIKNDIAVILWPKYLLKDLVGEFEDLRKDNFDVFNDLF